MRETLKLIIVSIVALIIVSALALFGKLGIAPKVVSGCCQIGADSCASGPTVTRETCVNKLEGEYCVDKVCNTVTGKCE